MIHAYEATPDYWMLPEYNLDGNDYSKTYNDNWMSMGLNEWTISRIFDSFNFALDVDGGGDVGDFAVDLFINYVFYEI